MSLVRIFYDLRPWSWGTPAFRRMDNFGFGFSPAELQAFFNFPDFKINRQIAPETVVAPTIGTDGFKVSLNMQEFKPAEITVKTVNNAVVVEGKFERSEDGQQVISEKFLRKFVLPKDFDTTQVESTLTSDGILTITAPAPPRNERIIEIKNIEGNGAGNSSTKESNDK